MKSFTPLKNFVPKEFLAGQIGVQDGYIDSQSQVFVCIIGLKGLLDIGNEGHELRNQYRKDVILN